MTIEPKPLTGGQESLLARAHATTLEQIDIAKQIVEEQFKFSTGDARNSAVIALTDVLATNYLAAVTRSAG
ncbi:hypothetical protein GJ698_02300 [Pseudoduganella sp. FT26W]|uniref:Uncharacterized protein n=1 Tax=Duganella aquatilis TaxID=2666082 RepID=A0A844CVW9_9BURK|nr:hypothetical protein [Duganella aquatilis]MRW82921.1 hypothetical protein [Duganella aquatilis]